MKESNTKMKDKINWRRNKVQELSVKGFSQQEQFSKVKNT
jgi:hypothetical protein